jgi:SSS family solute:Na+ symporter
MLLAAYLSIMNPPSMIYITQVAGSGHGMVVPSVIGLFYWKRSTKEGAFAGLVAGVIVGAILTSRGGNPFQIVPFAWALLANAVVFIVVSLMTTPPSAEYRANYLKPLTDNITRRPAA